MAKWKKGKGGKVVFCRHGGLSPVKQKVYDPSLFDAAPPSPDDEDAFTTSMRRFHAPPARKGFYAFVWPYIERFLLGGSTFRSHRMEWVRDEKGGKVWSRCSWEINQDGEEINQKFENHPLYEKLWEKNPGIADKSREASHHEITWYLARHVRPRFFEHVGPIWHHLEVKQWQAIDKKGSWTLSSFEDWRDTFRKEVGKMAAHKKREGIGFSQDHLEVFIERIK